MKILNASNDGMSLIEMLIVLGIMSGVMFAGMTFFNQQLKSNNYLEFSAKREQLRLVLLGQFLNDPNNCRCLFQGSTISGDQLKGPGSAPEEIGPYKHGTCDKAQPTDPFVSKEGRDGLRSSSIRLTKIVPLSETSFTGSFEVQLQSTKIVSGPSDLIVRVPVALFGEQLPDGRIEFRGCALQNDSSTITNCPSGWARVGDPGKRTSFCIQETPHAPDGFYEASRDCGNINLEGFGRAKLCDYQDWALACRTIRPIFRPGMTSSLEWVGDGIYMDDNKHNRGLPSNKENSSDFGSVTVLNNDFSEDWQTWWAMTGRASGLLHCMAGSAQRTSRPMSYRCCLK